MVRFRAPREGWEADQGGKALACLLLYLVWRCASR